MELGGRAFSDLGDYRMVLPAWLEQPNVTAWIDADAGVRRGFSVIGFFHDEVTRSSIADVLALAVEPAWQRLGIGRALVDHAVAIATATIPAGLTELRLCVADDNPIGQRLYRSRGFRPVEGDFGIYAGGQRAIRMVYPLQS